MQDHLASRIGQDHAGEQAYAQSYYAEYHDFVVALFNDPNSTEVVPTLNSRMWPTSSGACTRPTMGMNRAQIIDYLKVIGPISTDHN